MTVGEQIKFYRTESNMTQKKLSKLTGIAEITIRQYEAGKYQPKIGNLQKIADILNIPLAALLDMPENSEILDIASRFPSATVNESSGNKEFDLVNLDELHAYFTLNDKGKRKALSYIDDLSKLPEYTEDEPPANE